MGASLAAVVFGAGGGLAIGRTTVVEIVLCLVGAALAAAALVLAPAGRVWGATSITLFAGLSVLTAASLIWAIQPSDAWLEASRTFSYLAVFVGAVSLVRLVPAGWSAVVGGVALAGVAVCGWALLTKVFPGALNPDETYARLREPFGYWNAVGLTAALAIPPCLWLGARRTGHAAWNAVAYPAVGLLLVTMMLAYSRGSLLALAIGLAFWFAVVPLRLRALAVLVGGALGAAGVVAFAFTSDALSKDKVPLADRTHDGHILGVLLVVMIVLLMAVGWAVGFLAARRPPSERTRRRAGIAALGGVAAAPLVALLVLALSPGGVSGQVSKGWHSLTSANARTPANDPSRLTATASVRSRYWREAVKVWEDHVLIGAGAGAYATTRTRYRHDTLVVRHAHGYVVQTLADLGLAGLAASLALLAAWLAAALRATGLRRRERGRPFSPERIGLVTLATVVLVFGVHSLIDWTWFIPGTAVIALLCAGWLAGRGPLFAEAPTLSWRAGPLFAGRAPSWRAVQEAWRRLPPLRLGAAAGVLAIAIAASWATFQPLRAVHAGNDALLYLSQGRVDAARNTAHIAERRNPLSVDPLFDLAVIEDTGGRPQAALAALTRAVSLQPANPQTWERLADYELTRLNRPKDALQATRAALFLDPRSPEAQSDFLLALRAVAATVPRHPG